MSRAMRYGSLSAFLLAALLFLFLSCVSAPPNPYAFSNTKINLTLKSSSNQIALDTLVDSVGNTISVGINSNLPSYVDSVEITVFGTANGHVDIDTMLKQLLPLKNGDTLWFQTTFAASGKRTIMGTVYASGNIKNSTKGFFINILDKPLKPAVRAWPHITVNGTKNITTSQTCSLTVTVLDSNPAQAHNLYLKQDTLPQIEFTPPTFKWTPAAGFTGTSTVVFKVTDTDSPAYFDTATVKIIVTATINAPHWASDTISLTGPEGTTLSLSLTDKCSGDSLSFFIAATPVLAGDTIINSVYSYTFAANDTNNYWPKIIAKDKKGNADTLTLHLWASHSSIDSIPPVIKHLNPGSDSITVNSSSYTVSVICTDKSGIASVKCSLAADTFITSRSSDSIWSATITGLVQGQYKTVIFLATDMSARANEASLNVYIKYDSTMADTIGPIFAKISGPASSSTVTGAAVTFTYTISDPSGVDSVYWTLNGNKAGTIAANANNQYMLNGTLSATGLNHIIIYAQDKSTRRNKSSEAIDLTYDPTANDKTGPVITKVSGLANNTRTANPNDTLVYKITDTSGVDTVYWTLNNTRIGVLTSDANNQYSIKTTLTVSHTNKIVIIASDKSTSHNKSTDTTVLDYNRPPVISGAHDTTIQELSTVQFTVTATDPDNDKITLTAPTMPAGATFNAITGAFFWSPTLTQTGANTVVFKANDGLDTSTKSISIVVSNMPAPVITVNPDSQTVKCLGSPVSFLVTATGTGTLSYQWKNLTGNLTEGHYKGTATNTLTIDTVKATDANTYTCVVTNAVGSVATSMGAKLTVNSPSTTPTSVTAKTPSICSGSFDTLTVTDGSLGTGGVWKWYTDTTAAALSTTGASISVSPTATTTYWVRAEGTCGNTAFKSLAVTINTKPSTPTGLTSYSTCSGTAVALSATAPAGTTLAWYANSACTIPLTSTSVSPTQTTSYYARAERGTGKETCNVSDPLTVTVTVNAATTVTNPNNQTAAYGSPAVFSVTASGTGPFNYQWKHGALSVGTNSNTLTINSASVSDTGSYTCTVTGACGGAVTSNAATLTVTYSVSYSGTGAPSDPNQYQTGDSVTVLGKGSLVNSGFTLWGWTLNGVTYKTGAKFKMGTSNVTLLPSWVVMDREGNIYDTVTINGTIWMKQNLKTRSITLGNPILCRSAADWTANPSTPKCCFFGFNSDDNSGLGALYNGAAITSMNNLAPDGWHIATVNEFNNLMPSGNASTVAMIGTDFWLIPGTNETGFSAVGAGYCDSAGIFNDYQVKTYFWASTGVDIAQLYIYKSVTFMMNWFTMINSKYGYSVRCAKNQ